MFTEITRRDDTRKHTILRYDIGSDVQELRVLRIVMATTRDYQGILQTAQSSYGFYDAMESSKLLLDSWTMLST
jgi:hypothetical protein